MTIVYKNEYIFCSSDYFIAKKNNCSKFDSLMSSLIFKQYIQREEERTNCIAR